MNEGAIVLAPIPQADAETKIRPVLLLRRFPKHSDWLACGVSTQLHQLIPGFDELIGADAEDFPASRLRQPSVIRLSFLCVLPVVRIHGQIGEVSSARHRRLLGNLAAHLLRVRAPG